MNEKYEEVFSLDDHPYLEVDSLLQGGFGFNPSLVVRNWEISDTARMLYCYLGCFGSGGNRAFPSYETILFELGWSARKFRNARNELVAWGLIVIRKERIGRTLRTVYYLPLKPGELDTDLIAKLHEHRRQARANMRRIKGDSSEKSPEINEKIEKELIHKAQVSELVCKLHSSSNNEDFSTENVDKTNNNCANCTVTGVQFAHHNIINNNDLLIDNDKNESGWKKIKNLSLKAVAPQDEQRTYEAYLAAIATGYSVDQIESAYQRYVEQYQSTNDTPRYAKKLYDWLTQGGGLAYYARSSEAQSQGYGQADSATTQDNDMSIDPNKDSLVRLRSFCYPDETFSELYGRYVMAKTAASKQKDQTEKDELAELELRVRARAKEYLASK